MYAVGCVVGDAGDLQCQDAWSRPPRLGWLRCRGGVTTHSCTPNPLRCGAVHGDPGENATSRRGPQTTWKPAPGSLAFERNRGGRVPRDSRVCVQAGDCGGRADRGRRLPSGSGAGPRRTGRLSEIRKLPPTRPVFCSCYLKNKNETPHIRQQMNTIGSRARLFGALCPRMMQTLLVNRTTFSERVSNKEN